MIELYRNLMNETGCLTGNVGDCIGRAAAMDARVKSLAAGMKLVGPALTVRVPPTDNLMIHKALTLIKPGDVLVIEGGGNHSWALLGWLMVSTARKLGVAGIVADGCVRDAQEIRKSGFPVFAAGLSPNGPFKEGPGEINYPISCGGQIVRPGDFIVADDDGVVVMRQEIATVGHRGGAQDHPARGQTPEGDRGRAGHPPRHRRDAGAEGHQVAKRDRTSRPRVRPASPAVSRAMAC